MRPELYGRSAVGARRGVEQGKAMSAADRDYFLERAEAEIDLGNATGHARAARAHYQLAAFCLDRAHGEIANDD
jgi:hypothetical protein